MVEAERILLEPGGTLGLEKARKIPASVIVPETHISPAIACSLHPLQLPCFQQCTMAFIVQDLATWSTWHMFGFATIVLLGMEVGGSQV